MEHGTAGQSYAWEGEVITNATRKPNQLFNDNPLKLGIFGINAINAQTVAPGSWHPGWDEVLAAALAVDDAGFEAIVPIARWKGYVDGEPDHRTNDVFDTFSFAAALGQATKYATIFSTVHASLVHPMMMAKLGATIDHIAHGRWALNIVGGWNRPEFDMFGIELREHQARYDFLQEWLDALRALWTADKEIDWDSENFRMKGAVSRPKPLQQPTPPVMNAGYSPAGRDFTARNSDIGFVMIQDGNPDNWRTQVAAVKELGRQAGRELKVWTAAHIVQAPSHEEATRYIDEYVSQYADSKCIDSHVKTLAMEAQGLNDAAINMYRRQVAIGFGWVLPGPPEFIADELQAMTDAGFDGVLLGWHNFIDGIAQFRRDVMPILEARNLRKPFAGV